MHVSHNDPDAHAFYTAQNRKLYGAILQAVPDWLRTSLHNGHRNDGASAISFLRASYDANDANDHAAHMARLQAHYIDPRNEISEDDLRLQYDSMMTAKAGIIRTGNTSPPDSALIAMFDNALPTRQRLITHHERSHQHSPAHSASRAWRARRTSELGVPRLAQAHRRRQVACRSRDLGMAPRNQTVHDINETVLDSVDADAWRLLSADSLAIDETTPIPIEYFNSIEEGGLPPHELKLKRGVPIMLLRYLNPREGFCNGTHRSPSVRYASD